MLPSSTLVQFVAVTLSALTITTAFCYIAPKPVIRWLSNQFPNIAFSLTSAKVSLTFDDAPTDYTEELLDILDKFNIKATFFVISSQIDKYKQSVLVRAVQNGHFLGNHGQYDRAHWKLNQTELVEEISECDLAIERIYLLANRKRTCKVYRPGCGFFTSSMMKTVENLGYIIALGSVYPHDPIIKNSWINHLFIRSKMEPSDIIILHDREWTIGLLPKLLTTMKENKYQFTTLECLVC